MRGRAELLNTPGVTIVGSRRCSPYGRDVARRFGRDLAGRGLTVISGLALGIDAAAHEGALEAGNTVSVLGCGVDIVYPAAHRGPHERILPRPGRDRLRDASGQQARGGFLPQA
ncbi:MAG: DNA-processing protein DprA [Candidatus Latescibacterota bacterium]